LIEREGRLSTSDVVDLLRCSPPTARKEMEALTVLGVVDKCDTDDAGRPDTIITLAESFSWFKSEECSSLMEPRSGAHAGT
jgi:predicted ArsR family transcriptional regulator